MSEQKSAFIFSAIDRLSDKVSAIGERLLNFGNRTQDIGEHIGDLGEGLVRFGERTALTAALVRQGATKVHEWTEAMQQPAQDMQKSLAAMAAIAQLTGDQVEANKRHRLMFASLNPRITAEQWMARFTRTRGIFHDIAIAMRPEDIRAMLTRLGVDSEASTRLMKVAWSNLRTDAANTGDQLTRTLPVPLHEALALAGETQRILGGGRSAMMFASLITGLENAAVKGQVMIAFSQGLIATLQQLKLQIGGTLIERLTALKELGVSNAPQMLKLFDNLDEVAARQRQIGNSSRTLSRAYATVTANMTDGAQRLHQNWTNLADELSKPGLSMETRGPNFLSDTVARYVKRIEQHSKMVTSATVVLNGLGSAAYRAVQAIVARGPMSVFAGRAFEAIKYAIGPLGFESFALRSMYARAAITGIIKVTNLWATAQWLLNAALSATVLTIGGAVNAAATLGFAAYGVVNHWEGVRGCFEKVQEGVKEIFAEAASCMKDAGQRMMKEVEEGMFLAVEQPAESLASKIRGHFHCFPPLAPGPLRTPVLNFRLVEELAKHLKPEPVIRPAHRIAPAAVPAAAAGCGTVVIHYSPNITINGVGSAAVDWVKAARQHGRELLQIIDEQVGKRTRLNFA